MKILIVVANFVPEIGSAAHIYFDLATAFVMKGHDVDVITSYPREFYLDKKDDGKAFLLDESINGISVHRYKMPFRSRDNVIIRGFEHYWLPIAYYNIYKKLGKTFDVCLIYIPPLPLYHFAMWIKKRDHTPSILNFQDFHPQELVDVGVLRNKVAIKLMERMEAQAYRKADYITVMSKAGIHFIKERERLQNNIICVYNSVNTLMFDDFPKVNFKREEMLDGKILITYAGILSPFQGLDDILDAALLLQNDDDFVFYIIGDGMEKKRLESRVKEENIWNVKILQLQPRDRYFDIIASSDINLVSLDKRMSAPALPGKFINILGVGKPVIANVPAGNDIAHIVSEHECGIVTMPGDPGQIRDAAVKLKDASLRKRYGLNGKQFLVRNMDLKKNVEIYEAIFQSMINKERMK